MSQNHMSVAYNGNEGMGPPGCSLTAIAVSTGGEQAHGMGSGPGCASWLPGERPGTSPMKMRSRTTLLQSLMIERHLTREQTIEALERRARDMGVRDFALSLRQLDRWLAGDVATLPRPSLCR